MIGELWSLRVGGVLAGRGEPGAIRRVTDEPSWIERRGRQKVSPMPQESQHDEKDSTTRTVSTVAGVEGGGGPAMEGTMHGGEMRACAGPRSPWSSCASRVKFRFLAQASSQSPSSRTYSVAKGAVVGVGVIPRKAQLKTYTRTSLQYFSLSKPGNPLYIRTWVKPTTPPMGFRC